MKMSHWHGSLFLFKGQRSKNEHPSKIFCLFVSSPHIHWQGSKTGVCLCASLCLHSFLLILKYVKCTSLLGGGKHKSVKLPDKSRVKCTVPETLWRNWWHRRILPNMYFLLPWEWGAVSENALQSDQMEKRLFHWWYKYHSWLPWLQEPHNTCK